MLETVRFTFDSDRIADILIVRLVPEAIIQAQLALASVPIKLPCKLARAPSWSGGFAWGLARLGVQHSIKIISPV
jgi:hypothetical protein